MGAYSGVGAYLSSSGSEVGAYSGGGLIREWGLNRSFTVFKDLEYPRFDTTKKSACYRNVFGRIINYYRKIKFLTNSKSRRHHQMHLNFSRSKVITIT